MTIKFYGATTSRNVHRSFEVEDKLELLNYVANYDNDTFDEDNLISRVIEDKMPNIDGVINYYDNFEPIRYVDETDEEYDERCKKNYDEAEDILSNSSLDEIIGWLRQCNSQWYYQEWEY